MNVAEAARGLMVSNRGKFLLIGILIGVYVNVLLAIPFMFASEIFLIFGVIAFSALMMPVVAAVWVLPEQKPRQKAHLFLHGMTMGSALFAVIYLFEVLVGNYICSILVNPMRFSISRAAPISFIISLVLVGLFSLAVSVLKLKIALNSQ